MSKIKEGQEAYEEFIAENFHTFYCHVCNKALDNYDVYNDYYPENEEVKELAQVKGSSFIPECNCCHKPTCSKCKRPCEICYKEICNFCCNIS